ncbi:MAG: IclR family transcriptional regulator [Chloroflexota bacterium]
MSRSSSTAENVLDVLLLFEAGSTELTAGQISRRIGAPRSTTYRYIRTLRDKGFLEATDNDAFRLGPRLLQFARTAHHREDVGAIALPHMEQLCRQTRETVLLTRLSGRAAVCIERVEAPQTIRISFDRGQLQPLHAGASSKILLAYVGESQLDDYLQQPLERFTDNTITDPDALRAQLRHIRRQGYCISESEVDTGATAVAVPILDSRERLVAGLSTAGPTFRMDETVVNRHVTLLQETATAIQEQLAEKS